MDGECKHWWVFESPNGPTSRGQCKWCSRTIEGFNAIEPDVSWMNMWKWQDIMKARLSRKFDP